MKPILEKISKPHDATFACFEFSGKEFCCPYHYHTEYEITLILDGNGQRLVGDRLENFSPGDFVLLGSRLPHMYQNVRRGTASSRYIQFQPELFDAIFKITESHRITQLLQKSSQGIIFSRAESNQIIPSFHEIFEKKEGIPKFCALISLLDQMSQIVKPKLITLPSYTNDLSARGIDRLQKMIRFISTHYSEPISLEQIAQVGHLHPQSVARFFYQHLGKTFQNYLIETRLTRAVRDLIESKKQISEIAYDCGFNNLSNFNRLFYRYYQKTPKSYRIHQ